MATFSNSLVVTSNPQLRSSSGYSLKPLDRELAGFRPPSSYNNHPQGKVKLSTTKRAVVVQASYSDGGRTGTAGAFVGGFVLGGLVVGALGCVFAPQISKALADVDRKDLMRKLPKFIYDEEKALEKTRKILTEKIAQLNSAIDDVSSQLRTDHHVPNGGVVKNDEVEAGI